MRATAFLLLATLTACVAGGCGKKPDSTNPGGDSSGGEKAAGIEGTYVVTGLEMFGEKADEEDMTFFLGKGEAIVTITSDTMTIKGGKKGKGNKEGNDEVAKKYKLDPTKTPAEIDFIETKDGKNRTVYGIYKLEGDTLVIATTGATVVNEKDEKGNPKTLREPEAKDRPKEFKTRPDSFDIMMTLKKK